MIEDKARWNERHVTRPMSLDANKTIVKYIEHANVGQALDVVVEQVAIHIFYVKRVLI